MEFGTGKLVENRGVCPHNRSSPQNRPLDLVKKVRFLRPDILLSTPLLVVVAAE